MATNKEGTENKDEIIAQLERQLLEFKEAHQQSAAAIAVGHNSRSFSTQTRKPKIFLKNGWFKAILALVILVLLVVTLSGVIRFFSGSTFKQESVTFVEHVKELATLATVEAHMKVVLQEEDNKIFSKDISINFPGTKREILLVVPGTVIAGVDLKRITSEDMVINDKTKEIDITLPHADFLQAPSIQMDEVQTYVNGGLFRGDVSWKEGYEKGAEAQEQIRQDAISAGLLETAERNAEKVLKEFFKNINYTVNVQYK